MHLDTITSAKSVLDNTGRVCTPLRQSQRDGLRDMLAGYQPDMSPADLKLVGERDLVTMYDAACVDITRGEAIAANIARKYMSNPLLDPVVKYTPPPPLPRMDYATPPVTPAPDMSQYAKRSYVDQIKSDLAVEYRGKVRDLEATHKQHQTNLADTLLKVTEALPDAVRAYTVEALKSLTPVTLTVAFPFTAPVSVGIVHRNTPKLIKMLAAGENVYLFGPAGSGKTTAARKCADAFGLPFYFAAKVESEYMLLGFKDARGETVRTQFREAYEHGGVFLFDELDGSSPSAVVALNAALANGICPFPDGTITRHENFKCIGGGNTKLTGATREYVGRNQLDAASVDRFAFLEWPYDDALETALASNAKWCEYVQDARRAVKERALKHLITPRATYGGCKLLEAGLTWQETADAVLWKGLDADTVRALEGAMTVKPPKEVEIL